jgi:DNA-binding NtrC family response regulator
MDSCEILLLDDGSPVFRTLSWALASKGLRVTMAANPESFLESLHTKEFDLVMARIAKDRVEGMEVLKKAKNLNRGTMAIAVSGEHELAFPLDAYRIDIDDYLFMPCSQAELWRRMTGYLKRGAGRKHKRSPKAASRSINRRVIRKLADTFHYLRYSLDSMALDLKQLDQSADAGMDTDSRKKMQKMSARVEFLKEIITGFPNQISWN